MPIDLSEFNGDSNSLRQTVMKKRAKEQEKLDKLESKAAPIRAEILMYDKMIAAMDEKEADEMLRMEGDYDHTFPGEVRAPEIENQ